MNPCIAFRTDGIDIHLIIFAHDQSRQAIAHIPILNVSQETLKDAVVHPMTDGLENLHHPVAMSGVADVVCHDVEMFLVSLPTPYYIYTAVATISLHRV